MHCHALSIRMLPNAFLKSTLATHNVSPQSWVRDDNCFIVHAGIQGRVPSMNVCAFDSRGRCFVFDCSFIAEATTFSTPAAGPMGRSDSILHGSPGLFYVRSGPAPPTFDLLDFAFCRRIVRVLPQEIPLFGA